MEQRLILLLLFRDLARRRSRSRCHARGRASSDGACQRILFTSCCGAQQVFGPLSIAQNRGDTRDRATLIANRAATGVNVTVLQLLSMAVERGTMVVQRDPRRGLLA